MKRRPRLEAAPFLAPLALLAALGCGPKAPAPTPPSPAVRATARPEAPPPPASPAVEAAPSPSPSPEAGTSPSPSPTPAAPEASPSPSGSPVAGPESSPAAPEDRFERRVEADGSTTLTVRGKGEPAPTPAASLAPPAPPGAVSQTTPRPDVDPRLFDVPFYPKARVEGGATFDSTSASAVLDTEEAFERVVAFYAGKMKGAVRTDEAAGPVRTVTLRNRTTEVVLQQSGDRPGTRITLTTRR